jgi:glycerol-3-phosphate dehydrogenase subunit C
MATISNDPPPDAQSLLKGVIDACADCDTCRFLMDESCLLFPRLYRLWDAGQESERSISNEHLGELADLCTLCGLCPCPNIRTDIIRAKAKRVEAEGMPLGVRALADIQRFARLGGLAPKLVNRFLAIPMVGRALKKFLDIHPRRQLPRLATESFFVWARQQGLHRRPAGESKVAYFAGCTAAYLFPQVARAAVAVLTHNGIGVHVPDQQCCGMPTLLEGDNPTTLARTGFNLRRLGALARDGHTVVCSCPTCGFLLKVLLRENACFSEAYQRSIQAGADEIVVPDGGATSGGEIRVRKSMYAKILKDNGLFAQLDPLARIALSAKVQDLGQYLSRLSQSGRFNTSFGRLGGRLAYYAPCHQREQGVGQPYLDLLKQIPGPALIAVGGPMDCCGMGGSLGYKRQFHEDSLRLGRPLMEKLRAAAPTAIVTDCLSCRLQFQQHLPFPVYHPLELLSQAYGVV